MDRRGVDDGTELGDGVAAVGERLILIDAERALGSVLRAPGGGAPERRQTGQTRRHGRVENRPKPDPSKPSESGPGHGFTTEIHLVYKAQGER